MPEKNILSDKDGQVTFRIKTNEGEEVIQALAGGEFLWLLLQHVLPRRFRRVKDYGLLHNPWSRGPGLLSFAPTAAWR